MPYREDPAGPLNTESPTPLFVPVPERFAELLGYGGNARYIAIFWSHEADEVVITDGLNRSVGTSHVFLEYFAHPAIESQLGDLNIGLFDEPATVWLLLDRQARNLYYLSTNAAQSTLDQQHDPATVEPDRLRLREQVERVFDETDPAVDELRAHLDAFLGGREEEQPVQPSLPRRQIARIGLAKFFEADRIYFQVAGPGASLRDAAIAARCRASVGWFVRGLETHG